MTTDVQQPESDEELYMGQSIGENVNNEGDSYEEQFLYATKKNNDLIRWQQDLDPVIERYCYQLMGVTKDESTGNFIKTGDNVINDEGISAIKTLLYAKVNHNSINSNYKEVRIMDLCKDIGSRLRTMLVKKFNDFEIKDVATVDSIKNNIVELVESTLRRAESDGERKHQHGMVRRNEVNYTQGDNRQEAKKGFPFF